MTATRAQLRAMTRGAYDLQELRISVGLRLCANFRAKLGQTAGTTEKELTEDAQELLKHLRASYKRLTDGIARNRDLPPKDKFVGDELISTYAELVMVSQYFELDRVESQQFRRLEKILPDFPIYTSFLEPIEGIGMAMAAVVISEIDITRAAYPSSLWKYAGLDVAEDGMGRSRRSEHLIDREYTTKKGEKKTRRSLTFNPFLKTKLMGVIGVSFLRRQAPYSKLYYNYKHRLETDPQRRKPVKGDGEWNPKDFWSKQRIHDASVRYMVKIFLQDLYKAWRPLEGLPVSLNYAEAKFGHVHRAEARETTETAQRAEGSETTEAQQRADTTETPEARERAMQDETSDQPQRAVPGETPDPYQRADIPETTGRAERAVGEKSSGVP